MNPPPPERPPLPHVGLTGVGVAALRAAETARPDRLFEDPYAATFVTAAGLGDRLNEALTESRPITPWIAVRTRFLDDVVTDAIAQGTAQIVLLGAGLDTRAFRLDLPEATRVWELDLPDVLEFKEQVVAGEGWQPPCERHAVAVDLSDHWDRRLLDAGFDRTRPTVWIAEGLLAYLTPEVRDALLAGAAQLSAPGSRFGLTLADAGRLKRWRDEHPDGPTERRDYVALWQSDTPVDAAGWLTSLGWDARFFYALERSESYGRPVTEETLRSSGPRLVDAVRL
jgi:methyltransferase (TIGR00027 family)